MRSANSNYPQTRIEKSKGYTLIEMLVTLMIMGILFSVGYAGFRDFSRRQYVTNAVNQVKANLRLAQQKAISGEKHCTNPNETLNGYLFNVTNPSTYTIASACSGGDVVINSYTIPEGVSMSVTGTNPILFRSVAQGTNLGAEGATITFSYPGTSNTPIVTISASGGIK